MAVTKQTFMSRPKIRGLPAPERERRWKQHLMSEGGIRDEGAARRGGGRGRAQGQVRGQGDYFTDAKDFLARNVPKGTFSSVGKAIGGMAGRVHPMLAAPAGAAGGWAGDKLAQLVGFGDYEVRYNTLLDPGAAEAVAAGSGFSQHGSRVVISHRENLGTFQIPSLEEGETASPYKETRYRIQPTNKAVFPWLAGVANNFVEYQIHGLIFSFETTSSPYSATMGLGTIALATQHNANSLPYDSMKTVLNVENKATGNPAEDIVHGVECDPAEQSQEELFTRRSGDQGPPNLYDFGMLTIASEGLPAASAGVVLGQLFVTYQIELDEAELPPTTEADGKILFVSGNYTGLPANTPPLGPSLSLVKANVKPTPDYLMLDVSSSGDGEVELLLPKAGRYTFPDIDEEFEDMMYWFSDDTTSNCMQHLGFRYEGYYDACIVCSSLDSFISWAHVAPSVLGEGGSMVYYVGQRLFEYPAGTTPPGDVGTHTAWYKIFISEPGQSVSISIALPPHSSGTYVTDMMVTRGQEWDTSVPTVSGSPSLTRAERRRLKLLSLQRQQEAYDAAHGEEAVGEKGKWVETKVFVPDDETTK